MDELMLWTCGQMAHQVWCPWQRKTPQLMTNMGHRKKSSVLYSPSGVYPQCLTTSSLLQALLPSSSYTLKSKPLTHRPSGDTCAKQLLCKV